MQLSPSLFISKQSAAAGNMKHITCCEVEVFFPVRDLRVHNSKYKSFHEPAAF